MSRFRRAAAVIAASTLALTVITPALAAIHEGGGPIEAPGFVGIKVGHPIGEMGSFAVDGVRAWCIEKGVSYPDDLSGARTISNNPLAAYVLSRYGNTTDDITAAAVWYILGQDAGLQMGDGAGQRASWNGSRNHDRIEAKRQQILSEARTSQGPYSLSTSVTMSADRRTGTASVSGKVLGSVQVTLSGDATFTDGTRTKTVVLSNGRWAGSIVSVADGHVRVSAQTTQTLPASTFTLYGNGSAQAAVVAGTGSALRASDPGEETRIQHEPTIETTSSADGDRLKVGDIITDTIRVTGGKPGTTIRVQTRLYGPTATEPAHSANAPDGTPLVSDDYVDIKLDGSGNGTVTTEPYRAERAGWYSYDTDWAGDANNAPYDAGYGVPEETGFVATWTPEAVTQVSDALVTGPTALTDTVAVSGGQPGASFTGSATLYGPFETDPSADGGIELGDDVPTLGTVEFTGIYDDDGKATIETPALTVDAPGFYVWAETIDAVPNRAEHWTQSRAMESETSVRIDPDVWTDINDQHVLPGHTISDRVRLSGLVSSVGGSPVTHTVSGALLGPVEPVDGACEAVDWTDAPVALELPAVEVDAGPDGTAQLDGYGEYVVEDVGCYTYTETLTSSVEGDDTPVVVVHEPGHEAQTTIATEPTVETTISSRATALGEPVSDSIALALTGDTPWTVKAQLWQLDAPSCELTHDDWANAVETGTATILDEQTLTGTGDGTVETEPVDVEQTGCVTWKTTATFEGSTSVVESEYGVEAESGVVMQPTVETLARAEHEFAGASVIDTITLTGTYSEPGELTGTLLGPVEPVAGSCEAVNWTGAPTAGDIEPIAFSGDGEFTSSAVKTHVPGCYTFVNVVTMDNGISGGHEPGVPSETVLLVDRPVPEPTPGAGVADDQTPSGADSDEIGGGSDSDAAGQIPAGVPGSGSWNTGLVGAALAMLLGAGGVGYRAWRQVQPKVARGQR